jgi:hypothetical protein
VYVNSAVELTYVLSVRACQSPLGVVSGAWAGLVRSGVKSPAGSIYLPVLRSVRIGSGFHGYPWPLPGEGGGVVW